MNDDLGTFVDGPVAFVDAPDADGMGRLMLNGRYYRLPAELVKEIYTWKIRSEAYERDALRYWKVRTAPNGILASTLDGPDLDRALDAMPFVDAPGVSD